MRETMTWPEDGSPADFSGLCAALRDAFRQGYRLRRVNADRDIAWTGPPVPRSLAATVIDYPDRLTVVNLREYDKEKQGRDLIDVLIEIGIQLGYEQGRRSLAQWQESDVSIVRHAIGLMERAVERLEHPL